MWIERAIPWDRQPQGFARIRQPLLALGLVHALAPGLSWPGYIHDYANPNAAQPTPTGTVRKNPIVATPRGMALAQHPGAIASESSNTDSDNAIKTLRYPVSIQPTDDWTIIWCGYLPQGGGGTGSLEGLGALWALGADGNGAGWGARQLALSNGNLQAGFVSGSPVAGYALDMALQGGISAGQYLAVATRRTGAELACFSGTTGQKGTRAIPAGASRASTVGFDLGGSGQNPQSPYNSIPGWTITSINQPMVALVFRGSLTDEQIWSILANPWQAWERDEALYMPAVAATPGINLVAAPGISQPQSASVSITQTHQLVATGLLSQVASAVSALVQVHQVAAAASMARPVSTAVAIAQTHLPLAIASQVPTTSPGAAIGQTHLVASQAQSSTPSSAGASIAQTHVLVCMPMLAQPLARDVAISIPGALAAEALAVRPTSPAAAISQQHRVASVAQAAVPQSPAAAAAQVHQLASLPMAVTPASATASLGAVAMLGAVPMAAQPTMTAAEITQTHALIAAPASSLAMVSAGAIVQTHILTAALSMSRPRSYDVSLPPEYVLPAPDARRMFIPGRAPMRFPAPQRAMTLSAGASMQDLGKFEIARGERLDFDIAITEELRGEAASMVTAGGSASGITVDPTPIVTGGVMKVWATAADAAVRGQRATIAVSFSTASGLRRRGSFVLKVA